MSDGVDIWIGTEIPAVINPKTEISIYVWFLVDKYVIYTCVPVLPVELFKLLLLPTLPGVA